MSLLDELRRLLGPQAVLTDAGETAAYTEDWRKRYRGPAACVVRPASTAEVAGVVRLCLAHRTPVLPQGGNTSLCGGAVPDERGTPPVIVALGRMRRIRQVDAANNSMEVEAGCVLAEVQQAAVAASRLYPISLGAEGSCQIGGTIATNAGGTGVLRYGNTRDNVLGVEAVLPDGSIWDGLYTLRKNNTGLDLKHLFIGSEGTMGVVTAATLKLHPLPRSQAVAWLAPPTPAAALRILGRVQDACGASLSAFEMIDANQLTLVIEQMPNRRNPLDRIRPWHVLVELADNSPEADLRQRLEAVLERASDDGLLLDAAIATSDAQRAAFWQIRHSVSEANKKGGVGLTTDSAVPVSAVPAFIERATAAVHAIAPAARIVTVAHLGDGNVHFIPFFGFAEWEAFDNQEALAQRIRHAVNDVADALHGTFSAEHGIGRTLVPEMAHYKSPVELAMMRLLKKSFDPHDLFNPGRLLPAEADTPGRSAARPPE